MMNLNEIFSLGISSLAMLLSAFSMWYTRKNILLNQTEQERNDHVELKIELLDVDKNIFRFTNISHRRIIYLEHAEYKNVMQSLKSTSLGVNLSEDLALHFSNDETFFEENNKIIFYFRDDIGRKFSKDCEFYIDEAENIEMQTKKHQII